MGAPVFAGLYNRWNWIAPPLMVGALVAVVFLVQGVMVVVKTSFLLRVPLAEVQEIRFDEMGPVALSIEAPRGSTRFSRVSFELTGLSGERVEGRPVVLRTRTSGLAKARVEMMRFDLPWSGGYLLHMRGLGALREGDEVHSVVFTRPHRLQIIAYVVGMVAASAVLIVSLVFFVMRVRGVGAGSRGRGAAG